MNSVENFYYQKRLFSLRKLVFENPDVLLHKIEGTTLFDRLCDDELILKILYYNRYIHENTMPYFHPSRPICLRVSFSKNDSDPLTNKTNMDIPVGGSPSSDHELIFTNNYTIINLACKIFRDIHNNPVGEKHPYRFYKYLSEIFTSLNYETYQCDRLIRDGFINFLREIFYLIPIYARDKFLNCQCLYLYEIFTQVNESGFSFEDLSGYITKQKFLILLKIMEKKNDLNDFSFIKNTKFEVSQIYALFKKNKNILKFISEDNIDDSISGKISVREMADLKKKFPLINKYITKICNFIIFTDFESFISCEFLDLIDLETKKKICGDFFHEKPISFLTIAKYADTIIKNKEIFSDFFSPFICFIKDFERIKSIENTPYFFKLFKIKFFQKGVLFQILDNMLNDLYEKSLIYYHRDCITLKDLENAKEIKTKELVSFEMYNRAYNRCLNFFTKYDFSFLLTLNDVKAFTYLVKSIKFNPNKKARNNGERIYNAWEERSYLDLNELFIFLCKRRHFYDEEFLKENSKTSFMYFLGSDELLSSEIIAKFSIYKNMNPEYNSDFINEEIDLEIDNSVSKKNMHSKDDDIDLKIENAKKTIKDVLNQRTFLISINDRKILAKEIFSSLVKISDYDYRLRMISGIGRNLVKKLEEFQEIQ